MQLIIPDDWIQPLLSGGMLVWVLDKAHGAFMRHRSSRKDAERAALTANLVTEEKCDQRRASCRGSVDSELALGNRAFDWLEAAVRVLARKSGIPPKEIEDEMSLLRRNRGINHDN